MFTLLDAGPYVCGETPTWVEEEKAVYWVDTTAHSVYAYDFAKRTTRKYQPEVPVSAVRLAGNERFYLLTKWGLYLWTPESDDGKGRVLAGRDFLDPAGTVRFNDGIPLSNGNFVGGAFDSADLHNGNGFLYLLNLEGECRIIDRNLHVPNGMAATKDEKTFYMAEMYKNRVLSYQVSDDLSEFSNRKVHIAVPVEEGMPDGLLCDADDNLWIAHWRGWRMTRYDRQGNRNQTIKTPFATPTCQCFRGGDDSALVLTTATLELSAEEMSASEHPGGVFLMDI